MFFPGGQIDWFGVYDEYAWERMSLHGEDPGYMYPHFTDEHVDSSPEFKMFTDGMPQISAGMDKWALLANGGLQCNSVPIRVQRWPFIIQRCERPIRARYLVYWNEIRFPKLKVYVSGKGKRTFFFINDPLYRPSGNKLP